MHTVPRDRKPPWHTQERCVWMMNERGSQALYLGAGPPRAVWTWLPSVCRHRFTCGRCWWRKAVGSGNAGGRNPVALRVVLVAGVAAYTLPHAPSAGGATQGWLYHSLCRIPRDRSLDTSLDPVLGMPCACAAHTSRSTVKITWGLTAACYTNGREGRVFQIKY